MKGFGFGEVDKREHDKRYFLGTYGTFGMDTIHGRLFELQVYIDSMKFHVELYFAFTLVSLMLWPTAAVLAIPLAYVAGNNRDLQMFTLILVMAFGVGIALWALPVCIVALGGGMTYFRSLILHKEINVLDLVDFVLSELMILLTILFAWVFHEININTTKYKDSAARSWTSRHDEYGLNVQFPIPQYERLLKVLKEDAQGHRSTFTVQHGEHGGSIFIEDLIHVLEVLPGWNSHVGSVTDHYYEQTGEHSGVFSALSDLTTEAKEKNMWPIDLWLIREQYYPKNRMDLHVGLYCAWRNTVDMLAVVFERLSGSPIQLAVICTLALVRSLLPRFWLWFMLGGQLWPRDVLGPAGRLVVYSTMVTFVVSVIWISLFWFVLMDYRRNLSQAAIISALVDARSRVKFSQYFLMSSFWFGLDSAESEAVLSKMPLLDLRISSNVAAFWKLRDYCRLDSAPERMAISVLLEIVIIWLLLKFAVTMLTMYIYGGLPAVLIVTLFDLIVFGLLIIIALKTALELNGAMDAHKQVFVEAKYEVTMAHGARAKGHASEEPASFLTHSAEDHQHDLELSRRLLTEYIDLCNEYDTRDKILFGMTVTPGKIFSSVGTVGAMVFTLLNKMVQNGSVNVPKGMEDHLGKHVALVAMHTTANFLAHSTRAFSH